MNATLTTQAEKINGFISLFREGVEAWIKAGELLVEMTEANPKVYDEILAQCPQLNAGILARFEEMGRKNLHPQLLLNASPGYAKLRRLPFSLQERYINEPVPILIETVNGTDTLLVKAKDMSREQANQAFGGNRLRTEGEQRAYLAQKDSEAPKHSGEEISLWTKKHGKIFFNPNVGFTPSDLAAILAQNTK